MKVIDFLKVAESTTIYTIAEYITEEIIIDNKTAYKFTQTSQSIKKEFKQILDKKITFLYAYDNKKIKIFIE